MKINRVVLFGITFLMHFLFCVGVKASTVSHQHQTVFEKVIQNYTNNKSHEYHVVYKDKCFDCDSFSLLDCEAAVQMVAEDSIFGCNFFYKSIYNKVAVFKYYNGDKLFVLDTVLKTCTKFDPIAGQLSPINGSYDGMLIRLAPLFKPDVLRKILFSEKENTTRKDTIINKVHYIAVESVFEFPEEKSRQTRTLYINTHTFKLDRVVFYTTLDNQTEIRDLTYTDFNSRKWEVNHLEQIFLSHKNDKLKEINYESKKKETLLMSSNVDSIKGVLYPSNKILMLPEGNRITLLDFWYTACPPCIKSIPELNRLYAKYKDKVNFYGVNSDPDDMQKPNRMSDFLKKHPIDYPIVFTSQDDLSSLKINSFPTIYIIDNQGKLFFSQLGIMENENELYKIIDEKLTELLPVK